MIRFIVGLRVCAVPVAGRSLGTLVSLCRILFKQPPQKTNAAIVVGYRWLIQENPMLPPPAGRSRLRTRMPNENTVKKLKAMHMCSQQENGEVSKCAEFPARDTVLCIITRKNYITNAHCVYHSYRNIFKDRRMQRQ